MIEEDLSRPNLREHVYKILKKKIILREIKPGEKINEELLAKTLNISRTPIRETLFRLEHEGIVRIIPRRGAFVVSQSKEEIAELLYVREVLEGLTARMATENMDKNTLEKLRELKEKAQRIPIGTSSLKANQNLWQIWELNNLISVSMVIAQGALARKESRGAHFREDYPERSEEFNYHTLAHMPEFDKVTLGKRPIDMSIFEAKGEHCELFDYIERKY